MATDDEGEIGTVRIIDDTNDKKRNQIPSHQPSPRKSDLTSSSQAVVLGANDPGYKETHPIGSRKVTESIITYHEPIFQSVVNTLYESQKTVNMGKRKADEIDKGEPSSPDIKRKKIESPKTDTGFKVKKKCSIENIIERIRNEKTVSRGGGSVISGSEGSSVPEQSVCRNIFVNEPLVPHTVSNVTNVLEPKEDCGLNRKCKLLDQVSYAGAVGKQIARNLVPPSDTDKVLDLSMKTGCLQQKVEPSEIIVGNSKLLKSIPVKPSITSTSRLKPNEDLSSPIIFKQSENIPDKIQTNYKGMSGSDKMKAKDTSRSHKVGESKQDTEQKEVVIKEKVKLLEGTLNRVKGKLKQNKVTQSVLKHIGQKSESNSAIKTKPSKKPINKVTFKANNHTEKESDTNHVRVTGKKINKKVGKAKKGDKITKSDLGKMRKQKVPIAFRRVKREASLNAATLVNILYENSKSPKLNAKRSKSESDIASSPKKSLLSSQSFTDIVKNTGGNNVSSNLLDQINEALVVKNLKKEPTSPKKEQSSPKKLKANYHDMDDVFTKQGPKSPRKEMEGQKRCKESISDEDFDEIFQTVMKQRSKISKSRKEKSNVKFQNQNINSLVKIKDKANLSLKTAEGKSEDQKKEISIGTKSMNKHPSKVNFPQSKSPEEIAERKRKANLARLKKAKELLITNKLHNAKDFVEFESDSSESDLECGVMDSKTNEIAEKSDDSTSNKKVRAKKGELCRSARTHVQVETKTVLENASVAPQWCECCQSSYYPSQPRQGTKMWRIKQLIDKGTQNPPELIQSASHHFIAAHASCEVRPYSSPTHVSVLDSGPYVAPLMSHSHVTCTACGCRHTGMLHTAQCQSYALLPCQRYSSTYSVPYPHGHASYPHCGCGSVCSGGSFHSPGQPLLHQPQIPMSTEAPILVHHTVPLHDTSHSVPLQISHSDSGLAPCQVPVQITDSNTQQVSLCCQLSQGEIIIRTNSQSDQEFVDVGRDDFVKKSSQLSVKRSNSGQTSKLLKDVNKPVTKVRKNSSTSEIKKSSPAVKRTSESSKKKLRKLQVSENKNIGKEKQRKKSDSAKKRKPSGNQADSLENKAKSGNSGKTKGGKINLADNKEENKVTEKPPPAHGWSWEGEGIVKKVTNIFDGQPVQRKCFQAIRHEDGEIIHVKDSVLVCSGRKEKDIPYVAKVTNFWEDPATEEMMMTLLWYYRPEHVEGGRRPDNQENEVFAAKHQDESLVACIDDRGFVLTYNEYCRFMGEVLRSKYNLPIRKKVVPDPEEPYPSNRIPPLDVDPENVFLCRHVYDLKLKRVLKNPS